MELEWSKGVDHRGTPYKEAYVTVLDGVEEYYSISVRQYPANTFVSIIDLFEEGYSEFTQDGDGDGMIFIPTETRYRVPNTEFNADPQKAIETCLHRYEHNWYEYNP